MKLRTLLSALFLPFAAAPPVAAPGTRGTAAAVAAPASEPIWAFEPATCRSIRITASARSTTDMRFVIRHNATPAGQGMVWMYVDGGSLRRTRCRARLCPFRRAHGVQRLDPRPRRRNGQAARARGAGLRRRHQCLDRVRPDGLQAQPAAQRQAPARHRADADARDRQRTDLRAGRGRPREAASCCRKSASAIPTPTATCSTISASSIPARG